MDITKDQFDVVPTWIQLCLDFKYWSKRCFAKLVSPIGRYMKVHGATTKKKEVTVC